MFLILHSNCTTQLFSKCRTEKKHIMKMFSYGSKAKAFLKYYYPRSKQKFTSLSLKAFPMSNRKCEAEPRRNNQDPSPGLVAQSPSPSTICSHFAILIFMTEKDLVKFKYLGLICPKDFIRLA